MLHRTDRSRVTDGMDAPYHGVMCARMEFGFELQTEGASAMDFTTIGFDLAKTVFQVHGGDVKGRVVLRRKLRRGKVLTFFAGLPTCLIGMEACASAHYWAREAQALGHKVRMIPPQPGWASQVAIRILQTGLRRWGWNWEAPGAQWVGRCGASSSNGRHTES